MIYDPNMLRHKMSLTKCNLTYFKAFDDKILGLYNRCKQLDTKILPTLLASPYIISIIPPYSYIAFFPGIGER